MTNIEGFYGLNCIPSKFICWSSNTQYVRMCLHLKIGLERGDYFKMKPSEWAPVWSDRYPYRERKFGLAKEPRGRYTAAIPHECTMRGWPSASQRERTQKKTTLLALWSRTSGLWNCGNINFCYFSHPICRTSSRQPEQAKTRACFFLPVLPFLIPSLPSYTLLCPTGARPSLLLFWTSGWCQGSSSPWIPWPYVFSCHFHSEINKGLLLSWVLGASISHVWVFRTAHTACDEFWSLSGLDAEAKGNLGMWTKWQVEYRKIKCHLGKMGASNQDNCLKLEELMGLSARSLLWLDPSGQLMNRNAAKRGEPWSLIPHLIPRLSHESQGFKYYLYSEDAYQSGLLAVNNRNNFASLRKHNLL